MTDAGDVPVVMGIIPVWLYHKDNPNNKICVYALLDNASGETFIIEDSLRRLGVEGSETKLLLTTMHGTQEVDTKAVDGLMACHFQENEAIVPLPRTYVRQRIPADRDEIPRTSRRAARMVPFADDKKTHTSLHGRRRNRTPDRTKLP